MRPITESVPSEPGSVGQQWGEYPGDAVLALPDRLYSFPLQKTIVHEAATGSLREAADTLHRTTGQRISTGLLMHTVTAAAADIRDFYQHQPITAGCPADLLVPSIDATGVAMIPTSLRTPAPPSPSPHPPHAQLSSKDRTGRTRMATVTACYDAVSARQASSNRVLGSDLAPICRDASGRGDHEPWGCGAMTQLDLPDSAAPLMAVTQNS
jgi:hypothetical protein